jgi:thiol-disulfide isomerase/thioredoxin
MLKGGIKIFLFFIVIIVIVFVSASLFSMDYHGDELVDQVQEKAEDVVTEKGKEIADKVAQEGKELATEAIKSAGEKVLEEAFDNPGYFGTYDADKISEYSYVILFFTAAWCPSCVEAEDAIEGKKSYIPPHTALMTVDFDKEELREQYNVERQHTFILLDSEGNEIKRWTNSVTLEDIIFNSTSS